MAAILLPSVVLAPVWQRAGLGAGEDDVLYYYPSRVLLAETIHDGHWPWLNPWTGLGRPYAADPQSALWYPLTWLFVLLPPLWAYPASLWLHYGLALLGMYVLLRRSPMKAEAALFGAVAFAFCGFLLAHRAHFAMQHAAAWTPWVFWRFQRYAQRGGLPRLASFALVATLQCLSGHVQIAALTGVGALVHQLATRERSPAGGRRRRIAVRWLLGWVCVAGLFAVQWLPTYAYVRLCTRTARGFLDFTENSWNPVAALGWITPMLFGQRTPNFFGQSYWGPSHQVEQFAYAGLLPLMLAAGALGAGWRSHPRRRPWVILAGFAILLGLGRYGPVCPLAYWLPGASLFRVPARALLLFNLAVSALAAGVVHDLASMPTRRRVRLRALILKCSRRPLLVAVGLVATPLVLVLAALPWLDEQTRAAALAALRPWNSAIWVPLLVAWGSTHALRLAARRWREPRVLVILAAVVLVDLGVIGWTIDVPPGQRNAAALLATDEGAAWQVVVQKTPHRLWVVTRRAEGTPGEYIKPLAKMVANTNMLAHVQSLTDYGPLQPKRITRRFGFAPWGETERASELLTDTSWMRLYDVGWVLLCEPEWPAPQGCELVCTTPSGMRLFHNPLADGPAFFERAEQPGAIHFMEHGPNAFTTRVDTWPAGERWAASRTADVAEPRLIVARLALPGWQACVAGEPVPVELVDGLLPAVRLPAGQNLAITWEYTPPGLLAGALISLVSAALLVLFALPYRRSNVRDTGG
ncbi:MAG: hypothetical protein KKB50_17430 [Planctomycetes bacterium]|nr:hypothetical protein [Planctomycetota bacterium]